MPAKGFVFLFNQSCYPDNPGTVQPGAFLPIDDMVLNHTAWLKINSILQLKKIQHFPTVIQSHGPSGKVKLTNNVFQPYAL